MVREEFEVAVVGAGPGGPGERGDARFVRGRDAGRRAAGVELDVAARDGREHGARWSCSGAGGSSEGAGAFDRRRVAGMGVRDARRRGSRRGRGGGPTDARAGAARQPDRRPRASPRTSSSRCSRSTSARSRASGSSAVSSSSHWSARATAATCSRSSARATRRRVRARYVIGADGVRSSVREELGIATEGDGRSRERARGRVPRARSGSSFASTATASTSSRRRGRSFIPAGKPDRWVFAMNWDSTAERRRGADHGAGRRGGSATRPAYPICRSRSSA